MKIRTPKENQHENLAARLRQYFLFQNGEAISYAESSIDLKQAGFARLIWLFANKFALLYGIIAIMLSGLLGWVVSLLFTRLKLI